MIEYTHADHFRRLRPRKVEKLYISALSSNPLVEVVVSSMCRRRGNCLLLGYDSVFSVVLFYG